MRDLATLASLVWRYGYTARGYLFPTGADGVEVAVSPPSANGQSLVADDTEPGGMKWGAAGSAIDFTPVGFGGQFGDGLSDLTTAGLVLELRMPWAGNITRIVLDADASCSAVVDVKKNGTSIFGGGSVKPTLSTSSVDDKTSMTGVTVALAVGDIILIVLDSVSSTPKRLTLTIFVERT